MSALTRLWRWWTDTWRAPGRARFLYGVMAIAFAALALAGILSSDALVSVLASLGTLVAIVLSVVAPRLSKAASAPRGEQGDS